MVSQVNKRYIPISKVHTARHKQIQYTYKTYENHNLMSVAKAVVMETKVYV
jgi:hypothetical protein